MVLPSWSTRKLNLSRNSRPHLGYAQQQQNNKHMEFGEISRKVWQNVKWDGKRGPWKVAILTKMVNWQRRSSPFFSSIVIYSPNPWQISVRFAIFVEFATLQGVHIDIWVYSPTPVQISPHFSFSPGVNLIKILPVKFTGEAIVLEYEYNSHTCKLQL